MSKKLLWISVMVAGIIFTTAAMYYACMQLRELFGWKISQSVNGCICLLLVCAVCVLFTMWRSTSPLQAEVGDSHRRHN